MTVFAATTAFAAAPAKPAPKTKKPPPLHGKAIQSDEIGVRFIVPEGWEPMLGTERNTAKSKKSPMYYYTDSMKNVELKGPITYYSPPQFYIESTDLTDSASENQISPGEQDEIAKKLLEETNKTMLNFRYEGSRRITVDGEAATAFACVATSRGTQELVRFRIVSLFRNRTLYFFVFDAPVDDFPRFDSIFTKTLQNYHFLTPLKKNPKPVITPDQIPEKKETFL